MNRVFSVNIFLFNAKVSLNYYFDSPHWLITTFFFWFLVCVNKRFKLYRDKVCYLHGACFSAHSTEWNLFFKLNIRIWTFKCHSRFILRKYYIYSFQWRFYRGTRGRFLSSSKFRKHRINSVSMHQLASLISKVSAQFQLQKNRFKCR